ncbi:glycosyltransferase [Bradyrhizobium sp. CCBAU 53338]|uniref:glycosyltransferase n=1 Tax=Bradyrhizobium sp. CCBAU 53338 TaxID=1325111 RepID=UPI00188C863D|nr:glycosyltransferase [Bradyrhizobium sp. CCBAU 53338]QOZ52002.1 glycosyl transferase family 1 [Bradyrhizobium sp. CCBAU 53338]
MQILHAFKVYAPDAHGGIVEAIARIAEGTPSHHSASLLVCRYLGLGSTLDVNGLSVERTTTLAQFSSLPLSPGYIPMFRKRLQDADVIAFHAPFPFVDIGILLGIPDDKALVIHWHAEITGRNLFRPIFHPLLKRSVERADCIIVSHPAMIQHSEYLAKYSEKCVVLPYGIDTDFWTGRTPEDDAVVAKLRQQYPRLIVACGRLVPYKGFDVLLRALKHVDAHLIIAGTGPLEAELREIAEQARVSDRVTFAGYMSRVEQRQAFGAANLFVLPSVNEAEAFGIVQLEAMCSAIPVVNTNLPTGVPWVARDGLEGLTVMPRDEVPLAAAMSRLLDDPVLAARLGAAARDRAVQLFKWQKFAADVAEQYQAALARRRRVHQ